MSAPILSPPSGNLTTTMRGVWWLVSRKDWTKDGQQRIDPTLGADPIAILTYAGTHFAAQFMKRDRSDNSVVHSSYIAENNTSAIDGYDAYFGTYEVNEHSGSVRHKIIGSINPSNTGMTTIRDLRVNNNELMIQLETTTPEGEPIIRTLVWNRLS